jgi:ketosteroid isomerase-like protein
MHRIRFQVTSVACVTLTLFLFTAPFRAEAGSGGLSVKDMAKIRAVNEAYATAWLKNDPDAVLNTPSNDAVLIPQGNRPVVGIEAIKKFWWPADGPRTTIKSFAITTDEIGGDGDVVYVRGSFQFSFSYEDKGRTSDLTNSGNYLMIMERQSDVTWRISHRMWGDLPANDVVKIVANTSMKRHPQK